MRAMFVGLVGVMLCTGCAKPPDTSALDKLASKVTIAVEDNIKACTFVTAVPREVGNGYGLYMMYGDELREYTMDELLRTVRVDAQKKGATHVVLGDVEARDVPGPPVSRHVIKTTAKAYKCSPGGTGK